MNFLSHNEVDILRDRGGFEAWTDTVRSVCGIYQFEKSGRGEFFGWSSVNYIGGLETMHVTANVDRIRRAPSNSGSGSPGCDH
jgi:hypothetical protein